LNGNPGFRRAQSGLRRYDAEQAPGRPRRWTGRWSPWRLWVTARSGARADHV